MPRAARSSGRRAPIEPRSPNRAVSKPLDAARSGDDEPVPKRRSTRRAEDLSAARRTARFRRIKWAVLLVTLGIYYLLPLLRWDRGPDAPGPGGADRPAERALLLLLHRDLAAGGLLPHRPADPRGDGAVPDERASPAASGAAISARRRCGPTCSCAVERLSRATGASACGSTRRPWTVESASREGAPSMSSGC